ncbi:MAG: YkgJ family cysteine cluster protein [Candidatus Woesearchaeota archaeon]
MICFHCGECCESKATQINVTAGDILRLSEYLKMPFEELIPEYIDINPFGSLGSFEYDLELGINKPCNFRKNNRCSVYKARPLNCRLFPTWIIAEAPLEEINSIIDSGSECHANHWTIEDKAMARLYMEKISKVFWEETKTTEELFSFGKIIDRIESKTKKQEEEKVTKIKKGIMQLPGICDKIRKAQGRNLQEIKAIENSIGWH